MKTVVRTIERVAPSDVSILITGESGVGKEIATDLIHALSPRAQGPLVKVNCAALPHELIESELFGSVKGAYTGAHADREGLFRQAQAGTILLDEISEMPLDTQSKLLRVLQEKEFRPVGGKTSIKADCRVIASTNRRPEDAIRDNKLREDLFYRISAVAIHLPPLRERREDILPLASAFLKRFSDQAGRTLNGFTPEAAGILQQYEWPGNVRQLENEVQRAVLVCEGESVGAADLSSSRQGARAPVPGQENLAGLEAMELREIRNALERNAGNKAAAARDLGVTRQTLYNKMKHFGLNP
jgi:transcriptional regulator with PAS, ATPase and Fis domain